MALHSQQQIQLTFWEAGERAGVKNSCRVHLNIALTYKVCYIQDLAVWPQKGPPRTCCIAQVLYKIVFDVLYGKRIWKRMDVCKCKCESLCCTAIITKLKINYTSIKLSEMKKIKMTQANWKSVFQNQCKKVDPSKTNRSKYKQWDSSQAKSFCTTK